MMSPRCIVVCAMSLLNTAPALSADDAHTRSEPRTGADNGELAAEDEWGDDEENVVLESPATEEAPAEDVVDDEWAEASAGGPLGSPATENLVDAEAPAGAVSPVPTLAPPARTDRSSPEASGAGEGGLPLVDAGDAPAAAVIDDAGERRVGDPAPLTRRAPLLPALGVEVAIRYGLVGTGPTRFINDIRFGVFDWLELRTTLAPYPASLMARVGIGDVRAPFGQLVVEGGLAYLDAGLRLAPEEGEAEVGVRAHVEGALTWHRAILRQGAIYAAAHWRSRLSMLSTDEQHAFAVEAAASYDLLPYLALTGGLGYAQTALNTPVRELAVNFVEHDRPGMAQFLVRNDGETQSLTWPMALTYGRVENFDVDLFVTTRLWPRVDVLFGAGVRWRWGFGRKPWEAASPS